MKPVFLFAIFLAFALLLVITSVAHAQDPHAVVMQAKLDLTEQHIDTQGSCGAFKITNLVAFRLRPQYGFLLKRGGNRAVPQPDGSCLDGDHTNAPGYATDYLIDRVTGFGFDLLGDGGGANNPQWAGPESDQEMVARNRANFVEPFAPFFTVPPVVVVPPPVVEPPVVTPPVVDPDALQRIEAKLDALIASEDTFHQHVGVEWKKVTVWIAKYGSIVLGAILAGKKM